jgi:hypothetical protein
MSITRLFTPTSGNAFDNVTRDPYLPIDCTRLSCLDIQLDIATHRLYARPRNAYLFAVLRPQHSTYASGKSTECRMHSFPQDGPADLDVRDTRLRILSDVHHQSVDPSHRLPFVVEKLLVQNITHEIHVNLR